MARRAVGFKFRGAPATFFDQVGELPDPAITMTADGAPASGTVPFGAALGADLTGDVAGFLAGGGPLTLVVDGTDADTVTFAGLAAGTTVSAPAGSLQWRWGNGVGEITSNMVNGDAPTIPIVEFSETDGVIQIGDTTGPFAIQVLDPSPYAGIYTKMITGADIHSDLLDSGPIWLGRPTIALDVDADESGGPTVGDTAGRTKGLVAYKSTQTGFDRTYDLVQEETGEVVFSGITDAGAVIPISTLDAGVKILGRARTDSGVRFASSSNSLQVGAEQAPDGTASIADNGDNTMSITGSGPIADIEVTEPAALAVDSPYTTDLDGNPLHTDLAAAGPIGVARPTPVVVTDADSSGGATVGDTVSVGPFLALTTGTASVTYQLRVAGSLVGSPQASKEFTVPAGAADTSVTFDAVITDDNGSLTILSNPVAVGAAAAVTELFEPLVEHDVISDPDQTVGTAGAYTLSDASVGAGDGDLIVAVAMGMNSGYTSIGSITVPGGTVTTVSDGTVTAQQGGGATLHTRVFRVSGVSSATTDIAVQAASGANIKGGIGIRTMRANRTFITRDVVLSPASGTSTTSDLSIQTGDGDTVIMLTGSSNINNVIAGLAKVGTQKSLTANRYSDFYRADDATDETRSVTISGFEGGSLSALAAIAISFGGAS